MVGWEGPQDAVRQSKVVKIPERTSSIALERKSVVRSFPFDSEAMRRYRGSPLDCLRA